MTLFGRYIRIVNGGGFNCGVFQYPKTVSKPLVIHEDSHTKTCFRKNNVEIDICNLRTLLVKQFCTVDVCAELLSFLDKDFFSKNTKVIENKTKQVSKRKQFFAKPFSLK